MWLSDGDVFGKAIEDGINGQNLVIKTEGRLSFGETSTSVKGGMRRVFKPCLAISKIIAFSRCSWQEVLRFGRLPA